MFVYLLIFLAVFEARLGISLQLPKSQYLALYDLYNATNGMNWVWSEPYSELGYPWDFGPDASPCTEPWQGIVCSEAVDHYDVVSLEHEDVALTGQIPDSIANLTGLRLLQLGNKLTGTIPTSLSTLPNLTHVDFFNNELVGTIPEFFCQLSELVILTVYGNNFNGTIPTCFGRLAQLTQLDFGYNLLTGPIPTSFTKLANLQTLNLEHNSLNGSLPSQMGDMAALSQLEVYRNHITGPIPTSICNCTQLTDIHMQFNHLSSSIPSCISNLTILRNLALEVNRLTGPLPETIGGLHSLERLELNNNFLSHTIPESVGLLTHLAGMDLVHNRIVGTIPSSVWRMPALGNVYLNANHLTGQLPDFTNASKTFVHINISANHFHGAIPESLSLLHNLVVFSAAANALTGTLPAGLSVLPLEVLQIGNNAFTGTIPASFLQLTDLIVFSLKGNQLTGNLDNVFTAEQNGLITVQLDDNQFTGKLPSVLFDLPNLISLSIVGSCLHGSLPSNICSAVQMEALVLYGLTTGASCRATGAVATSVYAQQFGGPFPECVLSLPKLRTLLLASNRLTGSIGSSVALNNSLIQLDLSHNLLTGSIPESIQNRSWALLDLSHNKLDGTLNEYFFKKLNLTLHRQVGSEFDLPELNITYPSVSSIRSMLSLDTNRLSGRVPNNIKPLRDLTVLAGNLFECGYDKSDLPPHDSDISNYECASNSFDLSIYLWLGLAVAVPVALLLLAWYFDMWARVQTWFEITIPDKCASKTPNLFYALGVFHQAVVVAIYCTTFCVFVLLPYYMLASYFEGTHTHQYAYVLSAIYTSGTVSFTLDVVLWSALIILFAALCRPRQTVHDEHVSHKQTPLMARVLVFVTFVTVNIAVVLGVNVAFVYTVLYQSTAAQTAAQVLLSLFKLGWSTAVSPWMIRQLDNYFIPVSEGPAEPFFTLQLLVALFNNIAIPCLVVMAVDPNCFSDFLSPVATKSVDFLLPVCVENLQKETVCQEVFYERSSLNFNPPFTYSYQCSASFITAYAPTFVYMSIATVFVNPLLRYGMHNLHTRMHTGSRIHALLSALLPRILQAPPTEPIRPCNKRERPLFRAVSILVTLLMQLGVLLTFGAIFPPVALAMAVSIVATVYTARWELHRFIQTLIDADLLHCLVTLDANCSNVGTSEQMMRAAKIIVCYSFAFYTLFLFDTLGDTQGFRATLWVLIVVPLSPPLLFYCHSLYVAHATRLSGVDSKCVGRTSSIEAGGTNQGSYSESDVEKRVETMNVIHATM